MDNNMQGKALLSVGVDAILSHQPQPLNKSKASIYTMRVAEKISSWPSAVRQSSVPLRLQGSGARVSHVYISISSYKSQSLPFLAISIAIAAHAFKVQQCADHVYAFLFSTGYLHPRSCQSHRKYI
jgi:hypothetical protein